MSKNIYSELIFTSRYDKDNYLNVKKSSNCFLIFCSYSKYKQQLYKDQILNDWCIFFT